MEASSPTHPFDIPAPPEALRPETLRTARFINELQSFGVRLAVPGAGAPSRRGGAGPSDHKAVLIDGQAIMAPVHTAGAFDSPYVALAPDAEGFSVVERAGVPVGRISFPAAPRFYGLQTLDGVPYSHIATLHGRDVLATTVLQTCIRYESRKQTCQFCAIGQSLAAGRTIARKTPEQLGEVARAAVLLDGVKHMVMTTGTPNATDRGAQILCESAFGVKAAVDLPIQAQCEPPDSNAWFQRMQDSGVDALGMHLEVLTPSIRAQIMPGKAKVGLARYFEAFAAAVEVFGRGQVSTYLLAGLGDPAHVILEACSRLIAMGVYPFVVPFTPITGTPLEGRPSPTPAFMHAVLEPLGAMLLEAGLLSSEVKAGCARCGACSALSAYERPSGRSAAS